MADANREYQHGRIEDRSVEKEMRTSYLDYAMSVIVGRALPDVRDGLKPVHRRILFAMYELSNTHDKPYKKSARVVGETLGKYHPHGDMAIYDSMVRMAQDFSMRRLLVDGQGNFGSVDGDSAAAMRYTEVRLHKYAEDLLADLEKETVAFTPNFDATLKEPTVLPCKAPNLIVNGSSGIAVGMATNMPPHNLGESVDALVAMIDKPDIPLETVLSLMPGPDFPTGGYIVGRRGIAEAYSTGRGIIRVRGKAEIVEKKKGEKRSIIITELPYQVNKAEFIKHTADLARDKKIEGISDIADRSDREGMEVEIMLKRDAAPDVVLNQVYAHTELEGTFGINNLALVSNQPKTLPMLQLLREFLNHRLEVVRKRSEFELRVAKERKHIVEGLLLALVKIDAVIKVVKSAKVPLEALMQEFSFTQKQAEAILEMKIRKLSMLESGKLRDEDVELGKTMEHLNSVLADERKIYEIIRGELLEMKQKYADKRRTEIIDDDGEVELEDLIADEEVAVIITQDDYIKRVPISEYRAQKRGGRGVIGSETKEEDQIKDIMMASTHDYLMFFTDKGTVHWLKVYRLPSSGRYAMGKAIVNLLSLGQGERVAAWIKTQSFSENEYLVMLTKNGIVKRSSMADYSRPRKGGIIAITLKDNDSLIDAKKTDGKRELILATAEGMAIRFKEDEVREIGRTGQGVIGIRLDDKDKVVGMAMDETDTLMIATENGYGKRTEISEYRLQSRGGKGVINIKTAGRNGKVIGIVAVKEDDQLLIVSSGGKMIRMFVKHVSVIGRNTGGVRLMKMDEKEKIVALEKVSQVALNGNGNGNSEAKEEKEQEQKKPEEPGKAKPAESGAAKKKKGDEKKPDDKEDKIEPIIFA
ncbi:MAG: DNA gyrase subunit A [Candidatus Micrarchaeota archaeon]|nr:DNA gyrase subunit A [Candidatus Micrarchaeota archaeon]